MLNEALKMHNMSNIRRDFVASNLRTQFSRLSKILDSIEVESEVDYSYVYESLKEIETNLRQIRKLYEEN